MDIDVNLKLKCKYYTLKVMISKITDIVQKLNVNKNNDDDESKHNMISPIIAELVNEMEEFEDDKNLFGFLESLYKEKISQLFTCAVRLDKHHKIESIVEYYSENDKEGIIFKKY